MVKKFLTETSDFPTITAQKRVQQVCVQAQHRRCRVPSARNFPIGRGQICGEIDILYAR